MQDKQKEDENRLVIHYNLLRRGVGFLGVSLPVILVAGSMTLADCREVQVSISNYYHTNMRDVFIGILCAISLFLFSYHGYEKIDNRASNLAGVLGLMVAFLPTSMRGYDCNISCTVHNEIIGTIHLIAAGLFFLVLSYMSLFLFTINKGPLTKIKIKRKKIYLACGYIMITCIALLVIFFALPADLKEQLLPYKPVFYLETISLLAFGTSWLTKGEFIFRENKL